MGRTLRYVGLIALAGAAWVLIATEFNWVEASVAEQAFKPLAVAGAGCLVLGLLIGLFSPVGRRLRQGRCVRCGASIERGQSYCMDHLKDTVHQARDAIRRGETVRDRRVV